MVQPMGEMPMNLQVSAQAQERLLTKLSSMGLPRSAATTLLEVTGGDVRLVQEFLPRVAE